MLSDRILRLAGGYSCRCSGPLCDAYYHTVISKLEEEVLLLLLLLPYTPHTPMLQNGTSEYNTGANNSRRTRNATLSDSRGQHLRLARAAAQTRSCQTWLSHTRAAAHTRPTGRTAPGSERGTRRPREREGTTRSSAPRPCLPALPPPTRASMPAPACPRSPKGPTRVPQLRTESCL
eukprot:4547392-Prymnesium_polylepis.1